MIDFLGKALKSKVKKQMKVNMLLADDSDDDYLFMKPERKPIERLIEESPDKVVKMNSIEYRQLPVIDQARVFYLNL